MAAIIFLKVDSPKRFYADPAASLAISLIIFYSAIPMSTSTVPLKKNISPKNSFMFKLNRSFEVWKNSFRGFSHSFRPQKGERGSSLSKLISCVGFFFFFHFLWNTKSTDSWCSFDTRSPCLEFVPIVSSTPRSLQNNLKFTPEYFVTFLFFIFKKALF